MYEQRPPALDILYRDQDLLVLNKPAWLLSVPGRKPENQDSLALRAQYYFPSATVVHRLDCATSGIMVMALNKACERHLSIQFQKRQVQKNYVAKSWGLCQEKKGKIEIPIMVDWPNRPKQKVDYDEGKPSTTLYEVIEQSQECTRFSLTPITGRSHQLRIHLRELGHPILGDRLYAPEPVIALSERLLLHAQSIEFAHPTESQTMHFFSECPF